MLESARIHSPLYVTRGRTLTLDEATKALALERQRVGSIPRLHWLEGDDRKVVLKVINARKFNANNSQIHLPKMNKTFRVRFHKTNPDEVFLSPSNNEYVPFVPCGWFRKDSIEKDLIEDAVNTA